MKSLVTTILLCLAGCSHPANTVYPVDANWRITSWEYVRSGRICGTLYTEDGRIFAVKIFSLTQENTINFQETVQFDSEAEAKTLMEEVCKGRTK